MSTLELTQEELELVKMALKYGQCYLSSRNLVTTNDDSKLITRINKLLTKINKNLIITYADNKLITKINRLLTKN